MYIDCDLLQECTRKYTYAYVEFVFLAEKYKQGKGSYRKAR